MSETKLEAMKEWFSDGGNNTIEHVTDLSWVSGSNVPDGNYRVEFGDGNVSDWHIHFTDDFSEVTDAYCYNDLGYLNTTDPDEKSE